MTAHKVKIGYWLVPKKAKRINLEEMLNTHRSALAIRSSSITSNVYNCFLLFLLIYMLFLSKYIYEFI